MLSFFLNNEIAVLTAVTLEDGEYAAREVVGHEVTNFRLIRAES